MWYTEPGFAGCRISRSRSPSGVGTFTVRYPSGIGALPDQPYPYTPIVPRWARVARLPVATSATSRLWVARTLLSTVYRLACTERIEYGAARCSAKCTMASGWVSSITRTSRSYSVARFRFTNPISRPDTSCQARSRSPIGRDRRERLHLKLVVDVPTAEVVQDGHVMTAVRQVQRGGPSTEPVAAKNQNAHEGLQI